jgi:hypothetical protein
VGILKPLIFAFALLCGSVFAEEFSLLPANDVPDFFTHQRGDTHASPPAVESRRRVIVYSDHSCPECLGMLRWEMQHLTEDGYGVDHRDASQRPAALRSLDLPVLHFTCTDSTSGWRARSGWLGVVEFERLFESHNWTVSEPLKRAVAQPVRRVQHSALIYRGQAEWSWPGDLRRHLSESPHNVARATIDSWSDGQCIAFHNAQHTQHNGGNRSRLFRRNT